VDNLKQDDHTQIFFEDLSVLARTCHFEQPLDALGGKGIEQFEKGDRSDENDQSCNGAGDGEMEIHISEKAPKFRSSATMAQFWGYLFTLMLAND